MNEWSDLCPGHIVLCERATYPILLEYKFGGCWNAKTEAFEKKKAIFRLKYSILLCISLLSTIDSRRHSTTAILYYDKFHMATRFDFH
jgi:hypothetical protein